MILGMLVIGGPMTVSGAVLGTFAVTFVFEGLREAESSINAAEIFARPVVGLTEVALACGMIGLLIIRPRGIMATTEVGKSFHSRRSRNNSDTEIEL